MKSYSERVDQKVQEILKVPGNEVHRLMYSSGANRMILRRIAERELRYDQKN